MGLHTHLPDPEPAIFQFAGHKISLKNLGGVIDNQLTLYSETLDVHHLYEAVSTLQVFKIVFKVAVKYYSCQRIIFLKRIATRIRRDLRQFYRNLIHILFKNLDDNSDNDSVLLSTHCKRTLSNFNLNYYEYKRNYLLSG